MARNDAPEDNIVDVEADEALRLLRAMAPSDDSIRDARTKALLAEIARGIPPAAGKTSRQPRRLRYALVAAAVFSALVLTAFTFDALTARTGWFGDPASTETDGSEFLLTSAPDYGSVLSSLLPDLPLPEGATWQAEIDRRVAMGQAEPALRQETGARAGFVFYAHCAWTAGWLAAHERGDLPAMAAALAVLDAIPERAEMAAVDGGGVRDSQRALARTARTGDVAAVQEWYQRCSGFPVDGVR